MGKPTGFMEYQRKTGNTVAPLERIKNFKEFHLQLPKKEQQLQAARCMACGVPFCQAGTMIAGMASGCPLHKITIFRPYGQTSPQGGAPLRPDVLFFLSVALFFLSVI